MTVTAPATMDDVAALAGVSTSTVSRALRDSPLVSESTRIRVREAARTLDFAVSRAASALASGRLGRIGVLVSGPLTTWFNSTLLEAAYATLREAGHELVIYRITTAAERAEFFATLPARRNTDALVVASFALAAAEQERLTELGVPVVYLNQQVPGRASAFIDDAAGAALGARHLINLGHRRIAYLTTRQVEGFTFSATRRLAGLRAAVAQHAADLPDDPVQVLPPLVVDRTGSGPEVGQLAVGLLLSLDRLPTAVLTETDELAISLLPALTRAGLRVPDDLSVLGFDDSDPAALFNLSTVAQPVSALGRTAAGLALELTAGEERSEPDLPLHRELSTRLVLRSTTAVPRSPA